MQIDETRKAISDIESRSNAIAKASQSEQDIIIGQIEEKYKEIGETAYTLHENKEFEVDKIASLLDSVRDLHQTLEEKKAKLLEIQNRYDEELAILKSALPSTENESAAQGKSETQSDRATCPSCGTAYTPGEMLFCRTCGNKLPENDHSEKANSSTTAPQSTCPNCNAKLLPDAMFCNSCGNKVA